MRETEKEGFNSKALLSYLKENHLIAYRAKNLTKGKRINGRLVECVALELPHIDCDDDEVLDEDEFIQCGTVWGNKNSKKPHKYYTVGVWGLWEQIYTLYIYTVYIK